VIVGRSLEDDRPEQLAGRRRGQLVGPDLVGCAGLLIGGEEQETEQLFLDRGDGPENLVDWQSVGGGKHGVRGDPTLRGGAARRWAPVENFEHRPLLNARHVVDLLEVGVAHHRVGDRPEGRGDGVDESSLAAGGLEVDLAGVEVDQVVDNGLGRPDLLAPAVGRLADNLVGVLAVGQANDADLVELDPGVGRGQLADKRFERLGPKGSSLLAGGIDVVGEGDLLGIAGEEADLTRCERRPE
jgi:hypothetical protein